MGSGFDDWVNYFLNLHSGVESKLCPLGTSATEWPIVHARVIMMIENLVE
jgi:hypothetical protein